MNIRLAALLASVFALAQAADVHPDVHRALQSTGSVNLLVLFKGGNAESLEKLEEKEFVSRGAMIQDMKETLEKDNTNAATEVLELLSSQQESSSPGFASYKKFWISNMVFIESASAELVAKLQGMPSVAKIIEEPLIPLPTPQVDEPREGADMELIGHQWGIERIEAPEVWRDGIFGQNVVVSNIDTGVRYTHEALIRNWRSSFGWWDPEKRTVKPYDSNGHGTHTMGTIAGGKSVGVAPGSTWIACKGCRARGCPGSDLLECAQWITCPMDAATNATDCSKAPNLVSNSWGGGQGEDWYQGAVNAWHKAGIIPIFALGNAGPGCSTASSPGDYANVIGVGSTNQWDAISPYSSRGPAVTGALKPDISAPGQRVYSAWMDFDNGYKTISGTSMACPHVAGAVALLLSANPNMRYEEIKNKLTNTADQNALMLSNQACGATSDVMWPNNMYGHGRLNIYSAYNGVRAPQPSKRPTP